MDTRSLAAVCDGCHHLIDEEVCQCGALAKSHSILTDPPHSPVAMGCNCHNKPATSVIIDYTNWRGEFSLRRIEPRRVYFGSTEHHPEPQWLLEAMDLDKGEWRTFAMKDITGWKATPVQ